MMDESQLAKGHQQHHFFLMLELPSISPKTKKSICVSRVCNPKHKKRFEAYFQCISEATSTVETESLAVNLQVSGCANGEQSGLQQTFRRHNTKCRVLGLVFLLNVNRHAHNEYCNHMNDHRNTSVLTRRVKR
jgi:hypothetical protein